MSNEHGDIGGLDDKWQAFMKGCPNCSYRRRFDHLMAVKMTTGEMSPEDPRTDALLTWIITEQNDLLEFGYHLALENDKAKRRIIESVWN